jgi:hypothetical protein
MKKHYLKLISLFIIALFLVLWGCSSDDNPVEATDTALTKPTNLNAYSKSSTEVALKWTKTVDSAGSTFNGYTLKVRNGSALVSTISIPKDSVSYTIGSLTEGTIYDFALFTVTAKGTLSTDSATIKWSPAKRLDDQGSGKEIKVYETASSTYPSGLDFCNSTNLPEAVSIASSNANSARADLYIKTATSGTDLEITNPNYSNATFKNTKFSSEIGLANSLDDYQLAPPSASTYQLDKITIKTDAQTTNKIYWAKTQEGNYVRFILIRNSNNSLVWGTTPDRYLSFKISYQSVTGVIYSKTANK